jgi:glucan phosphoethanolaminetransferase (alkaline phosphatase superfamily)
MTWSILAIVFSFALALFTILFLRMSDISYKRLFVALGFLSFCCMVVSIIVAYGASNYSEQTRFAVVTKSSIPTYKESNKMGSSTLKEGDQLEILDTEINGKNYIQVSSQSGDTYLVKSTDVDFI